MKVFVVEAGWYYEGSYQTELFIDEDVAKAFAETLEDNSPLHYVNIYRDDVNMTTTEDILVMNG